MGMSTNIVEKFREYIEFVEIWLSPPAFARFMEGKQVVVTTRRRRDAFFKFEEQGFIEVFLQGTVLMMTRITQFGFRILSGSEPENEEAIIGKIVWA